MMETAFPMWILGVILILLGSLGNNLGNNLVSLAHKESKEAENGQSNITVTGTEENEVVDQGMKITDDSKSNEIPTAELLVVVKECPKRKYSMRTVGTLIFVFGNLFTFAAFGFAAQSLLASLESIQFVSNVVFAKYVHNEKITFRMVVATLSIVIGNVLVVIFSDHSAKLYTSRDILYLYKHNTAYQAYLAIAGTLWFINHFVYRYYFNSRRKARRLLWQHSFIEPFTFTVSSAIIGTQAVLLSKCMSMLIQVSAYGDNEFNRPTIFVVLVSWLILVSYWIRRLDLGLSLYPPLFIIPVMQVFFVFFAILCGGIYFEEFEGFNSSQYIGFVFGVVMILGGVFGLAPTDVLLIPPPDDLGKTALEELPSVAKAMQDTQLQPVTDDELERGGKGKGQGQREGLSSVSRSPYHSVVMESSKVKKLLPNASGVAAEMRGENFISLMGESPTGGMYDHDDHGTSNTSIGRNTEKYLESETLHLTGSTGFSTKKRMVRKCAPYSDVSDIPCPVSPAAYNSKYSGEVALL